MFVVLLGLFFIAGQYAGASKLDINSHEMGIWSIAGSEKQQRWIVIHNLSEAKTTGIYHIEVIQRAAGAPTWQIVRLVNHMAITEKALKRSVIKSLDKGAVYPEPFNDAFAKWKMQNDGNGGAVCESSVMECIAK